MLVTLTFNLVTPINRVPKLPRTDVWTKFEEGRSMGSEKVTD